jgi:sensor histidine kinase YesM
LKIAKSLWIIGFWILFTGGFYILDVADVFFWLGNMPFNTTALCLCQILSTFFLSLFATSCLSGRNKKVATISQVVLGVATFTFAVLSACKVVRIFDIRFYYYIIYAIHVALLCVFSFLEMRKARKGIRFVLIGSMVSMVCVLIDLLGVSLALWNAFYLSKTVFGGMLVVVVAFGIHAILSNYKMSIRAKEMEAEVKNKSIAVMISQIQPHFLYNSLNSIAELCVVDPKRAEKATIDFSRYLRGNMGALNEQKAIEFEDELKHLSHYIALEQLRYGEDLQFEYDIRERAFTLPALTVQPLVENAVNHGIRYHKMKGKVKIASYSDDDNYYVSIEDDGVGFDPETYLSDGGKHVGIANVRYRLEVICGGSVDIQSKKGSGTLVTIRIPKEK